MKAPERNEILVRLQCTKFERLHGTDAYTAEGMRARARIWEITRRKPTRAAFEAALAAINESRRIAENNIGLWRDGREVWPNDADYDDARAIALNRQRHTIKSTVQALLGDNTP